MEPLSVVIDNARTKEEAEYFAENAEKVFDKMGWTWGAFHEPKHPDKAAILRTIYHLFSLMTPEDFKDAEECGHYFLATGRIIVIMMTNEKGHWDIGFSLSP